MINQFVNQSNSRGHDWEISFWEISLTTNPWRKSYFPTQNKKKSQTTYMSILGIASLKTEGVGLAKQSHNKQ